MDWFIIGVTMLTVVCVAVAVLIVIAHRPKQHFSRWIVKVYEGSEAFENGLLESTENGFRLHSWRGVAIEHQIYYHVVYRHKTAKF